ncbi:DUF6881 domain-containing protein [Sinosporangium siamense]|uniref:DUF6881 domain-containing protein n=1 Tax=Sinosporangium siamense TaxID=1367973 RepID=A0A919RN43_9ACTN|nr:hypothetical protein [Sinosporangium siamense]GII96831.1 hypothetical protein Ssi02_70620 [Sinosporangium siamense]
MRYIRVVWEHDFDEPVLIFSELDEEGWEIRKVQVYRNGHSEWADATYETDSVGLSEIPVPGVEEISSDPEFQAELIDADDFERAWLAAQAGRDPGA